MNNEKPIDFVERLADSISLLPHMLINLSIACAITRAETSNPLENATKVGLYGLLLEAGPLAVNITRLVQAGKPDTNSCGACPPSPIWRMGASALTLLNFILLLASYATSSILTQTQSSSPLSLAAMLTGYLFLALKFAFRACYYYPETKLQLTSSRRVAILTAHVAALFGCILSIGNYSAAYANQLTFIPTDMSNQTAVATDFNLANSIGLSGGSFLLASGLFALSTCCCKTDPCCTWTTANEDDPTIKKLKNMTLGEFHNTFHEP